MRFFSNRCQSLSILTSSNISKASVHLFLIPWNSQLNTSFPKTVCSGVGLCFKQISNKGAEFHNSSFPRLSCLKFRSLFMTLLRAFIQGRIAQLVKSDDSITGLTRQKISPHTRISVSPVLPIKAPRMHPHPCWVMFLLHHLGKSLSWYLRWSHFYRFRSLARHGRHILSLLWTRFSYLINQQSLSLAIRITWFIVT